MKYLIILFLFFGFTIYGQTLEISGRVLNSSTKNPLPLANVIVLGKNIGTSTNESGSFILKGDFDKSDLLKISYIGFEPKEIKISALFTDKENIIYLESQIITSQTVLVQGTIGKTGVTPLSFSKINRSAIEETYTDQDIPEVLSYTPSATFYSENGNGLGYNYLSIRGFDQKRISVAVNGIPQNDPEDHNVYWIDFPDLLEGTELIQVQRGAGSGIAGFAAIGGSINIITSNFSDKPRAEISTSIGSYNTRKYSASVSTGLLGGKYSFYAKLSQTLSSGYRNSSWVNLKSYHLSAVRYDDNFTTQINLYGGPIEDGLAYTGLPKFAVKDKNLRKANYSYWEADSKNYSYTLERRPEEIENFFQPHFELLNEFKINNDIIINSALFLVIGDGFFDYDGSWSIYYDDYFRLKANGYDSTKIPENSLIRAQVDNKQWGWLPRVSIKHSNGELILGGELRLHNSEHWGAIKYAENMPANIPGEYKYYYYEGTKNIFNFYLHENYELNNRVNILAEAQIAYHNYKINNERYINTKFEVANTFFNPRLGLNYRFTPEWNFYLSYSKVSREPRLKNYYDAAESSGGEVPQFEIRTDGSYDFSKPLVNPETMNDFEIGSSFNNSNISASINLFYMLFNDEIVKQGQLDRFGQPITGNMDRTVHYGIEASANSKLSDNLEIVFNATFSKNYIKKGYAYFSDVQLYRFNLSGNRISGFPDFMFNTIVKFNYENLLAQFSGKYVGGFYSDNYDENLNEYLNIYPGITDYTDNKVEPYFTANLFISYNFQLNSFLKNIKLFFQVNNLFDNLYAANAIGKEYFPAAERNILFGVKTGL
jgi:iron complex outermembrane receptor protein